MEFTQLKGFVTVARLGNITRAAAELHVTQPALSIQIKNLEREIGEGLFIRKGRGLELSGGGMALLPRAEQVLDAMDRLYRKAGDMRSLKEGSLIIGTNDSNCLHVLPGVIRLFTEKYPGIDIQLINSHSSDICRRVKESTAEIGVITLPSSEPSLEEEELYPREDVLIYPPGHPVGTIDAPSPADLVSYPFLSLHKHSYSHSRLLSLFSDEGEIPRRLMRLGSIEVIKRYVQLGMGISVIPRLNIQSESESGLLEYRPLAWLPKHRVGAVRRKNGWLSPPGRIFHEMLKTYIASMPRISGFT